VLFSHDNVVLFLPGFGFSTAEVVLHSR